MSVLFCLLKHRVLLTSAMLISIINIQHMWKWIFQLKLYYSGHRGKVFLDVIETVFSDESGHPLFPKYFFVFSAVC